jgi:hypothetical protein
MIGRIVLLSTLCTLSVLALHAAAQGGAQDEVAKQDVPFLKFDKLYQFDPAKKVDWTDPQQVTAYSVMMCSQGKTEQLLEQMKKHVGVDAGLPKEIFRAVTLFGPDLTRFRDEGLNVKLLGYSRHSDKKGAFFYYLVKKDGTHFKTMPWIETWRSGETGRCSVVNIYVHDPEDPTAPFPIPDNLVTSVEKKR